MKRRVNLSLFLAVVFSLFCSATVIARTFTPPGEMEPNTYRFVENSDGTWTEYYQGSSTAAPIKGDTYDQGAMESADRVYQQTAVDSGTSSQTGWSVSGATTENTYAAEGIKGDLQTRELYKTPGEAEVGNDFVAQAESDGVLPAETTSVDATAGALWAAPIAGAAIAGVAIGTGIDELFGWPSVLSMFGGETFTSEPLYKETFSYEWLPEVEVGHVKHCSEIGSGDLTGVVPGTDWCEGISESYKASKCRAEASEGWVEHCEEKWMEEHLISGLSTFSENHIECASGGIIIAECHQSYNKERHEFGLQLYNDISQSTRLPVRKAYPASGLKVHETTSKATEGHVHEMSPVTTPIPIPAPSIVPAPARQYTIEKAKKKDGKPLILPIEEGVELPSPLYPVVPEIGHDELYTQYKTKLETVGFTHIEENILPDTNIDTSVGPNDVASVAPASGTAASPSTTVRVDVNPENAPNPGGEGGGIFTPPVPPGIDTLNFGVLCEKFPFGVPCWLVEEFDRWSTTAIVPKWTIPIEVPLVGYKTELKIDLTFMEPAMEIVRPILALMATIGLVMMFFHFAMGGTGAAPGGDSDE